jgi:hypothetical protein
MRAEPAPMKGWFAAILCLVANCGPLRTIYSLVKPQQLPTLNPVIRQKE